MKKNILRFSVFALVVLLVAACKTDVPTEPVFENAWIRPAPPGMKMTAGFGTIHNVTEQAIDLESFSSPSTGSISLHRTESVGGVSRMKEMGIFSLAPGSSLVMEPGGYHLMITMPGKPVIQGKPVTLEVHTSDGQTFSYEVPVEKR